MPDFQQYNPQPTGRTVTVTLPEFSVPVKVVGDDGSTILDLTTSPMTLPQALEDLTIVQLSSLLRDFAPRLIRIKAGLE